MTLWWLSFCDPFRPKGDQFLGVVVIEGDGDGTDLDAMRAAIKKARDLGIEPPGGCDVMGLPTNPAETPDAQRNRLLTKAEVEEIIAADDAEIAARERAG